MPIPTCPQCHGPLPPSGTTCPQCGAYVPAWMSRGGQVHGPYDWETLELLYFQGRLRADDRVTWDPQGNWLLAGEVFAGIRAPVLTPPEPAPAVLPPRGVPPVAPSPAPPLTPEPARPAAGAAASVGSRRSGSWLWIAALLALIVFLAGWFVGGLVTNRGPGIVRQTAERERCAGQLQLIALGMRMYAMDYGALPPGGNWRRALEGRGLPRSAWVCPARHDGIPYSTARDMEPERLAAGDPELAVVADAPLARGGQPHRGRCNVAYADGHTALVRQSPLAGSRGELVTWWPYALSLPAASGLAGPAPGHRP